MEAIIPKVAEIIVVARLVPRAVRRCCGSSRFPPITNMLDKRAETIRESLEKAEETRVEAERLLDEYKQQMAEARGEAAKVIEQGRKVADAMKDDIVAKANEEAAGVIAKAQGDHRGREEGRDGRAPGARSPTCRSPWPASSSARAVDAEDHAQAHRAATRRGGKPQ